MLDPKHLNPDFLRIFASQWGRSQQEDDALIARFASQGIDPPGPDFLDNIGKILSYPSKIQPQRRV